MAKAKVQIVHPPIEFDTAIDKDGNAVLVPARPCEGLQVRRVYLNDTARQLKFLNWIFSLPMPEQSEDVDKAA